MPLENQTLQRRHVMARKYADSEKSGLFASLIWLFSEFSCLHICILKSRVGWFGIWQFLTFNNWRYRLRFKKMISGTFKTLSQKGLTFNKKYLNLHNRTLLNIDCSNNLTNTKCKATCTLFQGPKKVDKQWAILK